ncbi:MAG: methyltransferase domain-containing protein [Lachnospiraceae bacterium]|nr:methyltransferase domain-containing protein [Lachnospiraceae bacterium]
MDGEKERDIRVLKVGCGLGEMLAKVQFEYPHSQVYGIEFQPETAEIGSQVLNIVYSDIIKFYIPFGNIKFDYIILADTLGCFHNPDKVLRKLKSRLKAGGSFLCRIPNFMHVSVVHQLLLGEFAYQDQCILDEKYFKFFTLKSIRRLYEKCGIYIDKLKYTENITARGEYNLEFLENVNRITEGVDKQQLLAYQYIFRAKASVPKKEFRITAVGMIRNAADVIETYIRANGLIVDNFVLLDNMCSDRTISILDELKKEGFDIEIIKDDMIEYRQSEKMNRLIYYVNEKYHSDFIIPIDDDECIVPFSEKYAVEDVRESIEKLAQDNLYYLDWRTYVPNEQDDENIIYVAQRQKYCYGDEAESLKKVIIPKGILADGTFEIKIGNHEGEGKLIREHVVLSFACMAHFPCRSEAQVRSKVLTGWTNFLASPDRKDGEGVHWEVMYSAAKKGERISLNQMQEMASLYVSNRESVPVNKKPVNLPEEAMLIKYTRPDEVNPWENYCTNVEALAEKYMELLKKKEK